MGTLFEGDLVWGGECRADASECVFKLQCHFKHEVCALGTMQAKWAEAVGEELGLMRAAQANLEQDLAASSKEKAQLLGDLQAAR